MKVIIHNQKDSGENILGDVFRVHLMRDPTLEELKEGPKVKESLDDGDYAFSFRATATDAAYQHESTLFHCIRSVHRILGPDVPIYFGGDFFK